MAVKTGNKKVESSSQSVCKALIILHAITLLLVIAVPKSSNYIDRYSYTNVYMPGDYSFIYQPKEDLTLTGTDGKEISVSKETYFIVEDYGSSGSGRSRYFTEPDIGDLDLTYEEIETSDRFVDVSEEYRQQLPEKQKTLRKEWSSYKNKKWLIGTVIGIIPAVASVFILNLIYRTKARVVLIILLPILMLVELVIVFLNIVF